MEITDYCIVFDIGGTRIKYGVVDVAGNLVEQDKMASNSNSSPEKLFLSLKEIINKAKLKFGSGLLGIGLGLTGGVHPDKGIVLLPGKLKDMEGFPIVEKLRQEFSIPVFAENDGRLAAYAERYFGFARDKEWAVVLTIGTGVGSGVILDGKILADPNLMFGTQLGHLIMAKSDDRMCLTGNRGTGEIFCSANALAAQVQQAIYRGIPSILSEYYPDNLQQIDFQKVAEACRAGDPLCKRELETWTQNLAFLIINAVHCYAAEVVILSGGATMAADLFMDRLNELVNQTTFRYPADRHIAVIASAMNEYSGIMGAAAFLFEKLNVKTV